MLRTAVVSGAECFEELRAEWQELVDSSPTATPFQTWEWQSTWFRHYRRTKRALLVTVREGNDLVGLMPLTRTAGPWRTVRAMGSSASDYLHPAARSGYEEAVSAQVAARLREMRSVDLIDLHQIRETQPLAQHAPATTKIAQATCLLLDLPHTFDAYLAGLSKSLRYDVRRLERDPRASVEPVSAENLDQGLQVFFEQHRRRWRSRGQLGAFFKKSERFHQDWAELAIRRGWLWLSLLKLDGAPVGAIYAMRLGSTCYYYQAGFDPAAAAISPGTLLVAETIRRSIEEGIEHFDFLRGDEPYKRRWKPQHELKNYRLLHARNAHLGGMGATWNEAGSKVEERIRARLEGRSLGRKPV
jgi:CelD/BcsL family acetyltransferase involved in cellulose biosynthesis